MEQPRVGVIIVAGGNGKRMGGNTPKQFSIVDGEPILVRSINTFHKALPLSRIVVVLPAEQIEFWRNYSSRFSVAKHSIVEGGAERFHSVKRGIEEISEAVDLIAIHDGVRPFASTELIIRGVECASKSGSAIPVVEIFDSLRRVEGESSQIAPRSEFRAVQTPQIFSAATLRAAYDTDFQTSFTDDASVVEAMGESVTLYEGEHTNIKITTPEDMLFAEAIAQRLKDGEDL